MYVRTNRRNEFHTYMSTALEMIANIYEYTYIYGWYPGDDKMVSPGYIRGNVRSNRGDASLSSPGYIRGNVRSSRPFGNPTVVADFLLGDPCSQGVIQSLSPRARLRFLLSPSILGSALQHLADPSVGLRFAHTHSRSRVFSFACTKYELCCRTSDATQVLKHFFFFSIHV